LLSGTRGGELRLDDGRLNEPVAIWDFANGTDVEVERACWDRHHEHNAYALTNDGKFCSLELLIYHNFKGNCVTLILASQDNQFRQYKFMKERIQVLCL
jgi:hypothetical protein